MRILFLKHYDMRLCIGDTLFSATNLSEDGYILKHPFQTVVFIEEGSLKSSYILTHC